MTRASPQLRAFLQLWWEEKDAPRPPFTANDKDASIVSQQSGLCAALAFYCDKRNMKFEAYSKLAIEMEELFTSEGLNNVFPFNDGSYDTYYIESGDRIAHLNPLRRAWVEAHKD